jgi:hypothetical protein
VSADGVVRPLQHDCQIFFSQRARSASKGARSLACAAG